MRSLPCITRLIASLSLTLLRKYLGAEYKEKYRSLCLDRNGSKSKTAVLAEICSFMDMVPPFRELATKSMGSMIEIQKAQLYELGESLRWPVGTLPECQRNLMDLGSLLCTVQSLRGSRASSRLCLRTNLSRNGMMQIQPCALPSTTCATYPRPGSPCSRGKFTTCQWETSLI